MKNIYNLKLEIIERITKRHFKNTGKKFIRVEYANFYRKENKMYNSFLITMKKNDIYFLYIFDLNGIVKFDFIQCL